MRTECIQVWRAGQTQCTVICWHHRQQLKDYNQSILPTEEIIHPSLVSSELKQVHNARYFQTANFPQVKFLGPNRLLKMLVQNLGLCLVTYLSDIWGF